MTDEIRYQPKGGMCLSCIALYDNCESLPFEAMPQIGRYDNVIIVKCTYRKTKLHENKEC